MNKKPHIFLTGFMGSGKSTLGKKTAALMKLPFKDLDRIIEEGEKKTIASIFSESGEETFRVLESHYLDQLLNSIEPQFIALGGGTICFHDNLGKVKARGLLIYLQLPAAALAKRIQESKQSRPLLKDSQDLPGDIGRKLSERKKFYEAAHIVVNGVNLTAQALQQTIIDAIPQHIS